jgi:hypothetical protein
MWLRPLMARSTTGTRGWAGAAHHAVRAGQDELHEYSLQALDRIARPVGGKALLAVLWPLIDAWSKGGEWQRRHAALMTIAQIAEGCYKVLLQDAALAALVAICCGAAGDAHAVVKWCACQAIGQVCTGAHHRPLALSLPALLRLQGHHSRGFAQTCRTSCACLWEE